MHQKHPWLEETYLNIFLYIQSVAMIHFPSQSVALDNYLKLFPDMGEGAIRDLSKEMQRMDQDFLSQILPDIIKDFNQKGAGNRYLTALMFRGSVHGVVAQEHFLWPRFIDSWTLTESRDLTQYEKVMKVVKAMKIDSGNFDILIGEHAEKILEFYDEAEQEYGKECDLPDDSECEDFKSSSRQEPVAGDTNAESSHSGEKRKEVTQESTQPSKKSRTTEVEGE